MLSFVLSTFHKVEGIQAKKGENTEDPELPPCLHWEDWGVDWKEARGIRRWVEGKTVIGMWNKIEKKIKFKKRSYDLGMERWYSSRNTCCSIPYSIGSKMSSPPEYFHPSPGILSYLILIWNTDIYRQNNHIHKMYKDTSNN